MDPEADDGPSSGPAAAPGPSGATRPDLDVDALKEIVSRHFRVYETEAEIRGIPRGQLVAFYVQMDPKTFGPTFERLREELRAKDPGLVVILQHRMGEDVILIARRPPIVEKGPWLNIVLLIATIITTTLGGSLFYQSYENIQNLWQWGSFDASFLHPRLLGLGFLTFSLPLITILGVHELGHYVVARRHRVRTSLPYFIPVPPIVPLGTFGAFISMKEPIPDRKALFDIGASGPIFGFLLAIPVLVLGLILTATLAVPVPAGPEVHGSVAAPDGTFFAANFTPPVAWASAVTFQADNESADGRRYVERVFVNLSQVPEAERAGAWHYRLEGVRLEDPQRVGIQVRIEAPPGANVSSDFAREENWYVADVERSVPGPNETFTFYVPANATRLEAQLEWDVPSRGYVRLGESVLFSGIEWVVGQAFPADDNVLIHPTGIAGWVGLLVTGFNLLPAGQLDGGHVARAVLGDRMKWASYASIAVMFVLGLEFSGWLLMAVLIVFLGIHHPPPLNDKTPLDGKRKVWAAIVLALLLTTFVPFPFQPV